MDIIKKTGNSLIHHGRNSDRVYVMKLDIKDIDLVLNEIDYLTKDNNYSKAIVKVPDNLINKFLQKGFQKEALVKGYFNGEKDGIFMVKYYSFKRKLDHNSELCKEVVSLALDKRNDDNQEEIKQLIESDYTIKRLSKDDVSNAVEIYKKVFKTYPFPIYEESYLIETMEDNLIYFGIWHKDKLIALSSIEMSKKDRNAEMTDFAVLDEYRGMGLAKILLDSMEKELIAMEYKTAYTIARAQSYGMNITFAKSGYEYGGMLINNTQIAGGIESMNVWYKNLV